MREELGWQPARAERCVDLFVDGKLIAWFYLADAPARDVPLAFEPGREGIWLNESTILSDPRLSDWHEVVLRAFARGERRADFSTPAIRE